MPLHTNPNNYEGSDAQRIQQAVDAATTGNGHVVVPRCNEGRQASHPQRWLLDEAIRLPSHITVELENCHLKLSDRCRDNFFRSANCGIGITNIEPAEQIYLSGNDLPPDSESTCLGFHDLGYYKCARVNRTLAQLFPRINP